MYTLPKPADVSADPMLLAHLLSVTQLETIWQLDERLDTGPSLPSRVRGAWGRALSQSACSDQEAAIAHSFFFPDKLAGGKRKVLAPPYRIITEIDANGKLRVVLRLIGFAGRWRRVSFDALISSLKKEPGLRLAYGKPLMANLELLDATWTRQESVAVPDPADQLALHFHSPLRLGNNSALGTNFGDIIVSIAERVERLSPWLGWSVKLDISKWREVAKATVFDSSHLEPVVWDTWSSANGHDRAAGYLGKLMLTPPSQETVSLLALGSLLHVGGRPSKGYGRYDLYADPHL